MSLLVTWVLTEWALTGLGAIVFLVVYGWPDKYRDTAMAWHIATLTAVTAAEAGGLFLVGLRVPVPLWTFAVIYGAGTLVIYWRLWLLIQTLRQGGQRRP